MHAQCLLMLSTHVQGLRVCVCVCVCVCVSMNDRNNSRYYYRYDIKYRYDQITTRDGGILVSYTKRYSLAKFRILNIAHGLS